MLRPPDECQHPAEMSENTHPVNLTPEYQFVAVPRAGARPTGRFLYKYGSAQHLDWLEPIVLQHLLYFPSPPELNDPIDARPDITCGSDDALLRFLANDFLARKQMESPQILADGVAELLRGFALQSRERWLKEMTAIFAREMEGYRIYSLSTRPDNEHLWNRYAGDHTGYCLEFENRGLFAWARHVEYRNTVTLDVTDPKQISGNFLFQKTIRYSPEEEVRIVLFPRGRPAQVPFDPTLLRRVLLGKNMTTHVRDELQAWAHRRSPRLMVNDEGEPSSEKDLRPLRALGEFVSDVDVLPHRLLEVAVRRQIGPKRTHVLLSSLPTTLQQTRCFLDRLTNEWRYDFGVPLDRIDGHEIALGPTTFHSVERLLDVLLCAFSRLTPSSLTAYLRRLADESRHSDVLAEMLAIRHVVKTAAVDFEVESETGNGTIDWRITAGSRIILMDVKNRLGDAAALLSTLVNANDPAAMQPRHATASLFAGVLHKFTAHLPDKCLHGVWVFTKVKQEQDEVGLAFAALDTERLHFAVLSNLSGDQVLLRRPTVDPSWLIQALGINECPDKLLFRRSAASS